MEFDEERVELYEAIIEEISPPDGEAVSSAYFNKELELENADEAISDLIRFSVLEFVNTSGSNMHVRARLKEPVPEQDPSTQLTLTDLEDDSVWLAYIVSGNNPRQRRAQRLFHDRKDAEDHLTNIAPVDSLTAVPGVDGVYCEEVPGLSTEYAVLRKEPIFSQADEPWP